MVGSPAPSSKHGVSSGNIAEASCGYCGTQSGGLQRHYAKAGTGVDIIWMNCGYRPRSGRVTPGEVALYWHCTGTGTGTARTGFTWVLHRDVCGRRLGIAWVLRGRR